MKRSPTMRQRRLTRAVTSTTTLVHVGDRAVRLLQVRHTPTGPELVTVKTRATAGLTPAIFATITRSLPAAPGRVILVLPKAQVLTRVLTLPADDPGELATMARYALADSLPYALDDCLVAVQRLQTFDKKTRVLAVITPKATLNTLLALLAPAGLTPQAIALSSEGLVRWHQCLLPGETASPRLVLETLGDTLELALVEQDRLLTLRSLPLPPQGCAPAWVVTQVQETLQGYVQERLGPPITQITVSGPVLSAQAVVATLSEHLNLPVVVADPTAGPFTQALAHMAEELTTQPWSDLLGLAVTQAPFALDLLPADLKQQQAHEAVQRLGLRALTWLGLCAWLGAANLGLLTLRHARWQEIWHTQHAGINAQATHAQTIAHYLDAVATAQTAYAAQMTGLTDLQASLPAGVALEQLTLHGPEVTVQGSAPTLGAVMQAITHWHELSSLTALTLQQATADRGGRIHFTVEARRR